MEKIKKNRWQQTADSAEVATIFRRDLHPEGLDVSRIRFTAPGNHTLDPNAGHLLSVIGGKPTLAVGGQTLQLSQGVHVYLPAASAGRIEGQAGAELVLVSAPTAQAVGARMLIRDEEFLRACSEGEQSLRWILTPQYLSRRIFLHHDSTLVSKKGHPVSWFHTTMFDVDGLPVNADGESVFKMSYNHRTEFNVCVDVTGQAAFRAALHPYEAGSWGEWLVLDGETTYYLNESKEHVESSDTSMPLCNKHEVRIAEGHADVFCLFDPAPTGVERHKSGEYSNYGPLSDTLGSAIYDRYIERLAPLDQMMEQLSYAKATGETGLQAHAQWSLYQRGLASQQSAEEALCKQQIKAGQGREQIVKRWMIS